MPPCCRLPPQTHSHEASHTVVCWWGSRWPRQSAARLLRLPPTSVSQCRLDDVESTGEAENHDPHNAPLLLQVRKRLVKQIEDTRPVGELPGVQRWAHQWAKVVYDKPLHGLHQVWSQGYMTVVIGLPWACDLWHWNSTQEVFHSSGTLSRLRLRLKICSTTWHSCSAQSLSSLELIPSGPAAFLIFVFFSWLLTWSAVRQICGWSGVGDEAGFVVNRCDEVGVGCFEESADSDSDSTARGGGQHTKGGWW